MAMRAVGWAKRFPMSGGAAAGRAWTREHLDALGWTTGAREMADAVVLAVSELITNAHLHARSSAWVVLAWDGTWLQLSVADTDDRLPTPGGFDPQREGRRGLALVDALADTWSAHRMLSGKAVTACFREPESLRKRD